MNKEQDVLEQWDNQFPPLNLWNYNLYWQWQKEWQEINDIEEKKES